MSWLADVVDPAKLVQALSTRGARLTIAVLALCGLLVAFALGCLVLAVAHTGYRVVFTGLVIEPAAVDVVAYEPPEDAAADDVNGQQAKRVR